MKRTIRLEFGEVSIREIGIIYARVFPNEVITVARAIDYHELIKNISKNQPHVSVIDITGVTSISAEARAELQKNSSEWGNTLAVALISNSLIAKMIGNFFLTMNKPTYPVKIFTDSLDAHQWAKNEYIRQTRRIAS